MLSLEIQFFVPTVERTRINPTDMKVYIPIEAISETCYRNCDSDIVHESVILCDGMWRKCGENAVKDTTDNKVTIVLQASVIALTPINFRNGVFILEYAVIPINDKTFQLALYTASTFLSMKKCKCNTFNPRR